MEGNISAHALALFARSRSLVFVGAWEPEVNQVRELSTAGRFAVPCSIGTVGVGMAAAAAATSRILAIESQRSASSHAPLLVFLGSAGVKDRRVALLRVACITQCHLVDAAALRRESYFPEVELTVLPSPILSTGEPSVREHPRPELQGLVYGDGYSCAAITSSEALFDTLAAAPGKFENLELFGVAAACKEFDVPWVALCPITNYVGPNAHQEWRSNHEGATKAVSTVVEALFC